jgi:hypothetical protein
VYTPVYLCLILFVSCNKVDYQSLEINTQQYHNKQNQNKQYHQTATYQIYQIAIYKTATYQMNKKAIPSTREYANIFVVCERSNVTDFASVFDLLVFNI